jgi:hypothetical protein
MYVGSILVVADNERHGREDQRLSKPRYPGAECWRLSRAEGCLRCGSFVRCRARACERFGNSVLRESYRMT